MTGDGYPQPGDDAVGAPPALAGTPRQSPAARAVREPEPPTLPRAITLALAVAAAIAFGVIIDRAVARRRARHLARQHNQQDRTTAAPASAVQGAWK